MKKDVTLWNYDFNSIWIFIEFFIIGYLQLDSDSKKLKKDWISLLGFEFYFECTKVEHKTDIIVTTLTAGGLASVAFQASVLFCSSHKLPIGLSIFNLFSRYYTLVPIMNTSSTSTAYTVHWWTQTAYKHLIGCYLMGSQ